MFYLGILKMGVSSRIAPIFSFPYFFCTFASANFRYNLKHRNMKTSELQSQLDAENLNFLNYILAKTFNVELQGYVYSEED